MTQRYVTFLSQVTAQASGALAAGEDPTSGSYTGGAQTILDSRNEIGSENCNKARGVSLRLDVTVPPEASTKAEIWWQGSWDGVTWTIWCRLIEISADIVSTSTYTYGAGTAFFSRPLIRLATVAKTAAFTANLEAHPFIMENQ